MKFDVVIIGGGLAGTSAATELQKSGLKCILVAEGLSLNNCPKNEFKAAGGTVLQGDRVVSGVFEGNRLIRVFTEKLGNEPLEADLDVEYDSDRLTWIDPSFAAPQRFLEFGVKTSGGVALKGGVPIVNLFPAGEVLSGVSSAQGDATEQILNSAREAVRAIRRN